MLRQIALSGLQDCSYIPLTSILVAFASFQKVRDMSNNPVPLLTSVAGLRCFLSLAPRPLESSDPAIAQEAGYPLVSLGRVGFVPTMGALHAGHLSLIQRARQETQVVVVSIFVNPLQFGPNEDFQQYPRTLEHDQRLCQEAGADVIFAPPPEALFSAEADVTQVLPPETLTRGLCGRSRPGHFQGVATIVVKLLNLVQPDRAYFGQKDAQQLAVIRRVVRDLNLPVQIVACPIVRAASGLALSSRNQYLTPEQQAQATVLYRSLSQAEKVFRAGVREGQALIEMAKAELEQEPSLTPEYIELVEPKTLMPLEEVTEKGLLAIAARIGGTRLIDNTILDARKPILAVDGPAGAGKSTVTRLSAQRLGLFYLDTGAMYRAVTWRVQQAGIDLDDYVAIAELVSQCQIQFLPAAEPQHPPQVFINDQEVTQQIRSPQVTSSVSVIAAQPAVRQALVQQQQQYGQVGGIAMEGRDIGTNVFPDAGLKIFLTASIQERARRRQLDLKGQGEAGISLEQLEQEILERDRKDSDRSLAPLRQAPDAVEINTDHLSIEAVIEQIIALYRQRFDHQ